MGVGLLGIRYGLRQISNSTIEQLIAKPKLVHKLDALDESYKLRRPSFIERFFGQRRKLCEGARSNRNGFQIGPDYCDLDKAWHGLHFLFTGSDWKGDPPNSFLLNWGIEMPTLSDDHSPSRVYNVAQTKEVAQFLNSLDAEKLRERFQPKEMTRQQIYPDTWDRGPSECEYLRHHFVNLQRFVNATYNFEFGMISSMG